MEYWIFKVLINNSDTMQTKHFLCLSGFSEVVLDEEKVSFLKGQPAALPPQPQNQLDSEGEKAAESYKSSSLTQCRYTTAIKNDNKKKQNKKIFLSV